MNSRIENVVDGYFPSAVKERARPFAQKIDIALSGTGKQAQSLRMAAMVFLIRVFNAAIAFISQILLARWMGGFDYGIFVAVWTALVSMSNIVGLGMPTASVRYIAKYYEEKDYPRLWGFFFTGIGLPFVLSALVAAIALSVISIYPDLINPYYLMPIFIAILCLPVGVSVDVVETAGRPFNWIWITFLPNYVFRPITLLLAIGLCVALGITANATVAMWCGFAALNIVGVWHVIATYLKLKKTVPAAKPVFQIPYWVKMALPMFLLEGFFNLQAAADVLLVSFLTTPEQTGVYFAAAKILALVHFANYAVRAAVAHNFSSLHTSGDLEGLGHHMRHATKMAFIPTIIFALLLIIFGKYVLMLFGSDFVSGTPVIWILAVGILIRSTVGPSEAILVMTGHQKTCASIYAFSLTANIVLNLLLIPQYGIYGAAAATATATLIETIALYIFVRRRLDLDAFIVQSYKPQTSK